jgi:NAD(P)-dependent dehydrogenase (short-subunit alcohol dehydrogenase family)
MSAHKARAPSGVSGLLRAGLLEGTRVVVAGPGQDPEAAGGAAKAPAAAPAVAAALSQLGARVLRLEPDPAGQASAEDELDRAADRALSECGGIDTLVLDGAGLFAAAGAGRRGLDGCLQAAWNVTRAVANAAFIGAEHGGGRIVYLAPAPGGASHADAACAGLENLCRTLSIEWARHGVTAVTIAPGRATAAHELGALVAYLCSPAGAYFSGCLLDLRGPGAR